MDTHAQHTERLISRQTDASKRHVISAFCRQWLCRLVTSLHRLAVMLAMVCAVATVPPVLAQDQAWEAFLPKAQPVGSGEFRFWGFRVYDATLWSPQGRYQPGGPFALSLKYARDISGEDIVQASIDQMDTLGFPVGNHPEWRTKLDDVMVSVKSGDTLTGVYMPGQGAVFFHNDRLTGQVSEALAKAFFSIWLDPKTSEPALRQALLGESP